MEEEKDKKWVKKGNFLANGKSLNEFIQNRVKRNEESIENQCGSSFVGMTKLLCFQTYDKLRTFKKILWVIITILFRS